MVSVLSKSPLAFTVEGKQLEERRDVFYYDPKYFHALDELEKCPWEIKNLGDVSKSIKDGPGGWVFHVSEYVREGIPMLRVLNIREQGLSLDNLVFITKETHEKLKRSAVLPGDVLLSMRGTIGLATVCPTTISAANINAALAGIRLRNDINPYYVATFLNSRLGRLQTERGGFRAVQSDLNLSIIKSIKIPIPPRSVQDKIADTMQQAYKKAEQRFKTAQHFYATFSESFLGELGVRMPEVEEAVGYWVESEDFRGRRDAVFYHPVYLGWLKAIESSPYKVHELGKIAKIITSGQRPKGGVKYIETGVPSLGGEHITADGDFNFAVLRFINQDFHKKQAKSWVSPLDILMVKDGATTGKVVIVPEDFQFNECNINEHVFKIAIQGEYDPFYIFFYLWSNLGQKQIQRLISGAAQKGITREAVESIKVIVPSWGIQKRIAKEASKRKEAAKKLKREAREALDEAKQKVENILTGGREK